MPNTFDNCSDLAANRRLELSQRLHAELARQNWRPVDLAAAAGIDKGAISRLLAGKRMPSKRTLTTLATALGCTEDALLPGGAGKNRCQTLCDYVRTARTGPGRVVIEMRRELPADKAHAIQRIVESEHDE